MWEPEEWSGRRNSVWGLQLTPVAVLGHFPYDAVKLGSGLRRAPGFESLQVVAVVVVVVV